jgi:hypothetical protein
MVTEGMITLEKVNIPVYRHNAPSDSATSD